MGQSVGIGIGVAENRVKGHLAWARVLGERKAGVEAEASLHLGQPLEPEEEREEWKRREAGEENRASGPTLLAEAASD